MKKIENFKNALRNLHDIFDYEEPYGNVELAGCVQLYEVCFEQAWKAMEEYLQQEGYPEAKTGSPKQVLKTAFEAGVIDDEQSWLDALAERNNVVHAYDERVALGIVRGAKSKYYELFKILGQQLDKSTE